MKCHILVTAAPRDGVPHVTIDVFDSERPSGRQTLHQITADLDRPAEQRPEWALTYLHYVLHEMTQLVALELDRGRDVQVLPAAAEQRTDGQAPVIKLSERWRKEE